MAKLQHSVDQASEHVRHRGDTLGAPSLERSRRNLAETVPAGLPRWKWWKEAATWINLQKGLYAASEKLNSVVRVVQTGPPAPGFAFCSPCIQIVSSFVVCIFTLSYLMFQI
jgi:hypothetical protein